MSRRKRIVLPHIPHHVTQRGCRRQTTFFKADDRVLYLRLLAEHSKRYGVEVLAYCLMTNHVHHLLVPNDTDSLRWTLQLTHKRYADFINAREGWTGHLWQQRFYSSPVDEEFFWVTMRYIERNPVEAKMVVHASDYQWSSAQAHCHLKEDSLLTRSERWVDRIATQQDWYSWLEDSDSVERVALLRKRTSQDLPTGSERFLSEIESTYGLDVRPRPVGRPRKSANA